MNLRHTQIRRPTRITCRPALVCALVLAAGCQATGPSVAVPAPTIQLLDAARFDLPAGCTVTSGRSYRMSYTIGIDGRTGSLGAITPPDAPTCLQAALATWVETFRFAPPAQAESTVTDWMLVTAPRGS